MIFFIVFGLLPLIIGVIFHKRITLPTIILIPIIYSIINLIVILSNVNIELIIYETVVLLCIFGICYFKYRFPNYDWDKRILSLAIPHIKKGRIIGRCFPYYKKQLKYNNSLVVQDDLSQKGSCLISGSSGSGKTVSMVSMINQDIADGKSVVFFDFKGDLTTLDKIKSDGVPTYTLTYQDADFTYDPLKNLTDQAQVEALLNIRPWSMDNSDSFYKTNLQVFIQSALEDFNEQEHNGNTIIDFYNFLQTYNVSKDHYDSYQTLLKLLELSTSNLRPLFDETKREFSFNTNEQFVLKISFTSSTKALATFTAALLFRDLLETRTKQSFNRQVSLYIDEYGSCETQLTVKDLLEKGRSCNIGTTLAVQDISQIALSSSQDFVDSILGTLNSFIIFAGATKTQAERLAGTQIYDIDNLIMSLKKPVNGKPPTAMFISKYPVFERGGTEVYRFIPVNVSLKEVIQKEENKIKLEENPTNIQNKSENTPVIEPIQNNQFNDRSIVQVEEAEVPEINIDDFL